MAYDPSQWFRYGSQFEKCENEQPRNYQNPNCHYDQNQQSYDYCKLEAQITDGGNSSYNTDSKNRQNEYDPSAPSITSSGFALEHEKPDPKKLDYYITTLQKFIGPLPK